MNQNVVNHITVSGDANTVNVNQHVEMGSDGKEMMEMVFKFILTLFLLPISLPILLLTHGYRTLLLPDDQSKTDY